MAHFLEPDDENLIHLAEESVQVEGLIRLLTRLGKRRDAGFIPFFLRLVEHHQLVDIQELALQSLASLPGVESELKDLFDAGTHDSLRTAIRVVGSTQTHSMIPVLLGYLENQSDFLRIEVIKALGKIPGDSHLTAIEKVLYDAKNPDLVEACLDALAEISSQESVDRLKQFALKTQNRVKALSALEHLVHYYHRWDFPLPMEESEFALGLLKEFIFDRDKNSRKKAYTIAARLVTWDLDLYHRIRELLKDAGSKLRAQSNWDKHEKPLLEKSQKSLNRSFYFLKDALENQEKIISILRQSESANSTRWIENFEKINQLIEISEYPFSSEFYTLLAHTTQKLLPEKTAWRERILLYNIAGFTRDKSLIPLLTTHLKTVSRQARNALIQALNLLGYSMQQIASLNQIKKVLLVEGSGFFRKRLVTILEKMDLEVYSATDVQEVEQIFSKQQPDLLLTEATLKSSGDLIPEIVKWKSSRQNLELIVQTNLRDAESLRPLVALSPRGILFKPFPLDQLKNMIVQ
jgi:CheY-like chemotaxis protein